MSKETVYPRDNSGATVLRGSLHAEQAFADGIYHVRCIRKVNGKSKVMWRDTIKNTVTTEGRNLALDTILAGSSYSVTGPYMGLISSVGYSAITAGDTAAQIDGANGWAEAGSSTNYPLYTTPRKTCVFSSASGASKALSAALSFPIVTTGGTVKGCFIIYGSGASSTIANTSGKLWSVGLFTGGDKVVSPGDTLQVSYTASM
jgi:hypothetical protein